MDEPAELMNSPKTISQNWGGYSARVVRKRLIIRCIKQGRHLRVAPAGLSPGTAAVIATTTGTPVATRAASA